ncbi:MAG: MBL fold metallo-hydrolase [Treponema sp.]|jgi:phosphoribosyl 1,2-cyclic phosphodiesterase|nr:MBL fold metallo-hydrolase [Treponema sp.]
MLSVSIWGARGSIPCPGPNTVVFGGNTACLEIRADERLVIVDLGTGVKPLGDKLMAGDLQKGPLDIDVFVTHTHWDHIMGFPVFAPVFHPGTTLRIRGPVSYEDDTLEAILGAQLSYRYWPVRLSELAAKIEYGQIGETTLDLGRGLRVITRYLNHPILCLGYRFEYQGKSIVTAFDTEPFRNVFPTDPSEPDYDEDTARQGEEAAREARERLLGFFKDADVLIYDSQYTAEEYDSSRIGWGHGTYERALSDASLTGVKTLVFFHHDPNRTDEQLAELEARYRAEAGGMTVFMAREGLTVEA